MRNSDSIDRQRNQSRLDRLQNSRHFYSTKSRRNAVKFEKNKLIKQKLKKLSKLNKELNEYQEKYLNCINQIGNAHLLAQLIEKIEQISFTNNDKLKNTNLQGHLKSSIRRESKNDLFKDSIDKQISNKLKTKQNAGKQLNFYQKYDLHSFVEESNGQKNINLKDQKSFHKSIKKDESIELSTDNQIKELHDSFEDTISKFVELSNLENNIEFEFKFVSNSNHQYVDNQDGREYLNSQIDKEYSENKKINKEYISNDKKYISNDKKYNDNLDYNSNKQLESKLVNEKSDEISKLISELITKELSNQITDQETNQTLKQVSDQISYKTSKILLNQISKVSSQQLINNNQLNSQSSNDTNRIENSIDNLDYSESKLIENKFKQNLNEDSKQIIKNENLNKEINLIKCSNVDSVKEDNQNLLHNQVYKNLRFNEENTLKSVSNEINDKSDKNSNNLKLDEQIGILESRNVVKTDLIIKQDKFSKLETIYKISDNKSKEKDKNLKNDKPINHKKYLADYLNENLSIRTPSLNSLDLISLSNELSDLNITPTLSTSLSSFPSINTSISSLSSISSDDLEIKNFNHRKKCQKCLPSTEKKKSIDQSKNISKSNSLPNFDLNFKSFWTEVFKDEKLSDNRLKDLENFKNHLVRFKKRLNK